jgi:zinc protease
LMEAIIRNEKKNQLNQYEYNQSRAYTLSDAFIMGAKWSDYVNFYDNMAKITKEEVVAWVNDHMKRDFCVVYKRTGEDTSVYKVDKPGITPIDLNRENQSAFYQGFEKMESMRLKPEFIDYDEALKRKMLMEDVPFFYVKNESNELFSLYIELDENLKKDKNVKVAIEYLKFLGTDKYTAKELKEKFYALGVQYYVQPSYIYIAGLNESFEESVKLVEHLLHNCEADETALENLLDDIKKKRADAKKSKGNILRSKMSNYAKYGSVNGANDVLNNEELSAVKAQDLVDVIQSLTDYKHSLFYYGETEFANAFETVQEMHVLPKKLKIATEVTYPELATEKNLVYFVDYDMVQTQMLMISKGPKWNPELIPAATMFNSYFGSGLSSILFQEIRESKALAYSAYSYMSAPYESDKSHYVQAFIGCQVNKLGQAVDAIMELLNEMPMAEIQFNESKISALKKIESDRITKTQIYWQARMLEKGGLDYDIREIIYSETEGMSIDDLKAFFDKNIKNRRYVFCVIGKKSEMDMEALEKLGNLKELSLEELFGY